MKRIFSLVVAIVAVQVMFAQTVNYYVKMDGKGDGSSWEKALNGETFAALLPTVKDGAIFHMAAGTYKPVSNGDRAPYYEVNSNITIQGGYPAQPKEGATSDPSKYQAIFDGDILGDDVIDETLDENGFPSLERTNGEDNVGTMFNSPKGTSIFMLNGVIVKNAGTAVGIYHSGQSSVTLKNSSFENNRSAVILNYGGGEKKLQIYSCSFVKNTETLFAVDGPSQIVMDSVIMEYNSNSTLLNAYHEGIYNMDEDILEKDGIATLSMNRAHVTKNKGIFLVAAYNAKVENSEFVNNQVPYVFDLLGRPELQNSIAEISNCKFLQNKGEAILASSCGLSVDNCLFEGNKGSNLIQIGGISADGTPNLIENSIVKGNESTGSYGLIYCSNSSNLYMHNNHFTGNVIPESSLLYCYSLDSIAVTNSTFQETEAEHLTEFVGSRKKLFEGNTITKNNTTDYLFYLQSSSTVTTFKNNTICSNECQSSLIYSGEDPTYLYNNTIVGNKLSNTSKLITCDFYHSFVHTIGNIILGNSVPDGKTEYLAIRGGSKRAYNIMSYTEPDSTYRCHELPDASNIVSIYDLDAVDDEYSNGVLCRDFLDYASRLKYTPEEILTTLFDGTYDKKTNLFTPKLVNNGGPTSTLTLKTDKLSDGTSIRFPLAGTIATDDQRGVKRLAKTCMGAYEIGCDIDTTKASDTILVGKSFLGKTYTTVGVNDSIFETLKSVNGCDSVVMHTLVVKPNPSVTSYIVTNTKNDGEGSLRYALEYANLSEANSFRIEFDFAQQGEHVIKLSSQLNISRDNLIIDGSSVADPIIIDGGGNDFDGLLMSCAMNVSIKAIDFKNCKSGIRVIATKATVEDCEITENETGITIESSDCVVDKCLISGNTEYGILRYDPMIGGIDKRCFRIDNNEKAIIQNCIIGLSKDQKSSYPNGTGIYYASGDGGGDTVRNNVISGNLENGIEIGKAGGGVIISNLIGVNDQYEPFGNGKNGILAGYTIKGIGIDDISYANIIGCNGEYGICSPSDEEAHVQCTGNYIGITPDGKIIGNKLGGVKSYTAWITKSVICGNEGDGILLYGTYGSSYVKDCVIGDKSSSKAGNAGYGIHLLSYSLTASGNSIWNNTLGGIYFESDGGSLDGSQNLFGGEQPFAMNNEEDLNVPTITNIVREGNKYKVFGHVDFRDGTPWNGNQYYGVDSSKVGIELFQNTGLKETAYSYIGYTESDETGDWSIEFDKSKITDGRLCLTATAIHFLLGPPTQYSDHSVDNYTSNLAEPFCACFPDTIRLNDTILVGASFLGKTYTTVGVKDSIFENLKSISGCDSIVMHKLYVKPDQKVLNYYVKTERHGTGDGSSWENAMDGKDFALYLPLAPKGATFYVAEGTYNPVYGMDLTESKSPMYTINNDVTIRGGYPANAVTGAASEPDKYKTIFDGDLLGDDEYDEQLDADGYPVINKLNTTENTSTLFFSVAQGRLKARFDGVVLRNVNTAIQLINPDKKLEVLNCSFDHNGTPISLTDAKDSIYVYNSSFSKNTGNVLYTPATQDIVLDSVLFESNASNISSSKSNLIYASYNEKNEGKEHLSMNRVKAIGNKANFNAYGYDTKVENSLFEANMATDLFRVLNNNKTFEIKKSKFIQNIGKNGSIINSDEKIIIDSCLFEKNDASNWDLIGQSSTNNGLYIQHSEFLGNKATDLIKSDAKGDIVISNCNMAENQVGEYLFNIRSSESTPLYKENSICNNTAADILRTAGGTHLLENNTIASNKVTRYILEASGGNLQLNNNTIVGNNAELRLTYLLGLGLKMTGNIILGNSPEAIYLNRCNIKDSEFKYNIAPSIEFIDDLGHCESISDISSNNIFSVFSEEVTCDEFAEIPNRNEEILTTLFSGTYNSTTGLFSPEVKNNGGPTPTVALKVDILPDGTSIRFPLTETTVSTDQRGVNRLEQTCMGAYEIACSIDTIKISDTILVGASFLGKTYTTVGVKDSIFENLKSISGCDSIVMHKLVVKPDQKVLNYYVKTEREGTGDGSSWENAMNGTDFANYLPLVPNGVTFYVAEGRYSPINNREENPSHILGDIKEYAINSSLSIIGGYPATAKTGATSDPQAYHTIFTGDPSGDDVYKEGYYNSAILQDINGDDMQVLYLFNATPSSEVYFFGCTFSGASYKPTYSDPETNERTGAAPIRCDNLKIEKCDFSTTGTIQNSGSSQSTLYASECIFHNRPSISTPSSLFLYDTIHVEKSLFEDMIGTTGGVFGRISKLADIKNSTFNNIGSSATLIEKAEHIRLYNNTFVGLTADGSSNVLFSSSRANKMEIVGNIFKGCKYVNLVDDASDPVHVIKNNLLENIIGTEADIMVSDVKDIPLEGTYDGTDAFTPAVKNNGGFTPTIALMKDKLADGTSIRFPLTETIVTDDQRGVTRLAKTCMGAYEIACSADTTVLSDPDIITVGERFLGVVYSEAGRYDSIFENLQNVMGCDSVVMHTVVVENPFEGCEIGTVLFREDFGGNYLSDPIAKSAGIPQCTYNYNENPKGAGNYAIRKVGWNHNQWFYPLYDHTFPDNGDRGYLMQVDGSGDNGVFYNTQIDDLCPNTHLTLSMWGMSSTSTGFGDDAKLKMILESLDGEVLATQDVLLVNNKGEWERFSVPYTVKEGQTSVVYKIINNSNTTSGNDFVLDDIEVRLCKPAVSVNSPIDSLCAGDDYVLTASYTNAGGYIEPLNFTWFKNEKPSYGLDGWTKVAEGQTLSFSDLKPEDNAYYRCVISSAGVPGEFNKCNSASDIVPILVKSCVVCVPDTTVLADPDVIFVGEQFLGVTYTEVGRHDSIFEILKDINGCDSVIMHTLNVQLNPDAKYYYVKTERHGTGDGSSWENAMNGEDLTTYLPLAPDGSTFYVAEGSFKPECEEDYCTFKINSNVTIRGGYPADAKTGDISDPKKYKTVFDGDKNGDNVITKTTDETGCPVIEVENTDDDAYDMFYSSAERNLNVTFYGISIINAGHGYNAYTESDESALNLNIDNCKFENCRYGAVQSVYLGSLKATESEFIQNGGCLLVPNVTNVELRDVKMENNYNNYLLQLYDNSSNVNKSVTMESVTATNNTAYMQTSGDVVVSNSTFNKNSCIPYFINEQISSEKSSKIHIRNTKFTDNNCNFNLIYASYSEMTVDTSLFQNNTVTTSMIYPHSLTMDSSRVIGNKCGTGVLFEIIKDVKLTNDIINENEAETAIHIYAPTDDVVLVDQCHVESNKGRLFKHENTANGLNVTMTNSEFIGNTADEDNTWINIIGNGADVTVLLNKNIIKENKVSAALITSVSTDFTMSECDVNNNTAKNIMTFASATVHITDNALYSNQVTSNVVEANVCWDGVEIVNNTIAANKSEKDLLSCYYTSTTYNNNTIVGNDVKEILFRYPYDKSFIGNIIWGNNYSELNYYDFSTTPQYNIMPLYVNRDYTQSDKIGVHIPNETNIVVDYFVDKYKTSEYEFIEEGLDAIKQYASINDIFFGTYDPSTSLFTPEIQNNGGFTPTIALKNDRLSDKTSIRFLLSETTVEQDQRGVERLVSTCMGAYEYMPSDPIECVYESILFKEDFGGNNPTDALYSENGLKEGLCTLPCAGDCPLALNDYMQTGCYALLKEAYRRQPGYKASHIYEGWYADFDDETYLGDVQRGYFMSIDMASKPTTFYQREINDLCENTNLSLSMSARPLYASDNTILYMSVEDMTGNPLTERTEVVIDKTVNEWQEYSVTFSVPQGASSVVFKIYSEGGHQGNDFALDDIIVRLCKAQVDVNRPTEPLCKHTDYTLTAQYSGDPSYLEPVNYTWFRNDKETYDLDGWVKVGTGKTYEFKDMTSAINGYYRCVVSSAGVEGEMSKCNSISDIVPIFVSEYTMEKDTVHILQGETFAGVTYEKVGVFRTSNREVNEFGCDKIVNHVVFVHPGGAEYYVTMDGRSAHTGVDWDNAIDSVEFATYLPLAKAGVVFHVAEGRYRPYFNSKYEKVSKRCYYEINNDVTIIGGYSKDELDETVPSNPKKYRTTFTTSINQENNKMVESTSPRLYSMHIDNEAFIGTSRGLFIANAKAKEVKLDGIVLNYSHGFVGDHSETNLTLNRCSFEEMSDPVHYVKSLHVDTCLFRKVSIGGAPSTLFGGVATEIIIRNTTITDILGGYNDMLTCDYHGINPSTFVLENSTLVNNYANGNLIILPSSGKVRIVNNTIVNNQIGTSLSSLFNTHENSVSVEITGNLIVGNENVSELSHVCTNTNGSIYKYNLLDLQQELPETNMKMLGRYTSILDGWNAGNKFIPTLRDNGGYTQTVALKSDRLDDGISIIRLPLEKTTVTADQRQYKRISSTCMGAYEIPLTDCDDLLDLPKEHKLTYETQYISFTVPYRCDVRVIVTDLQGRLVRDADMTYRDREGKMTVNLADLRLFELDHDPREPFLMTVKTGSKIHVTYLYITRLDKNY